MIDDIVKFEIGKKSKNTLELFNKYFDTEVVSALLNEILYEHTGYYYDNVLIDMETKEIVCKSNGATTTINEYWFIKSGFNILENSNMDFKAMYFGIYEKVCDCIHRGESKLIWGIKSDFYVYVNWKFFDDNNSRIGKTIILLNE